MRRRFAILVLALSAAATAASSAFEQTPTRNPGDYPLTPDSLPQDGVPKGRLEGPFEFRSQIITNTVRRYWIYVPAQYTGETPANVLAFQDGARAINPTGALRVPQVIEKLVFRKDIVRHEWGDGAHSDAHLGALLPDVLRWMFSDGR